MALLVLPCLTILLCVIVPCCVTRSIKQHIDTNRSDLRALNTNANTGNIDPSKDNLNALRGPWNDQDTSATDRLQMTNGNIPDKTGSRSQTNREANMNTLYNVNPEVSGQRRTNSNMGRDTNRSDRVVEGNITNHSVKSGVIHNPNPNQSAKKEKNEEPNETIHVKENGETSRHQGVQEGVRKDVHENTFHEAPPNHTWSSLGYSFLALLGVIAALFCVVCVVVKCPIRSESVSDSRSGIFGAQQSMCYS